MDPLRLLSRSTKAGRDGKKTGGQHLPSRGQPARPQPLPERNHGTPSRKRRKIDDGHLEASPGSGLDFFGDLQQRHFHPLGQEAQNTTFDLEHVPGQVHSGESDDLAQEWHPLPLEARKRLLKEHKLRITQPHLQRAKVKRKSKAEDKADPGKSSLFPSPLLSFKDLVPRFSFSRSIYSNITEQGFTTPTEVQLGALPLLLENPAAYLSETVSSPGGGFQGIDLLTVAPTGSGKTLAFLLPILHRLQSEKREESAIVRQTSALILAPTRELASQIANEGKKLVHATGVKVTQMRKGMTFGSNGSETTKQSENQRSVVKADIIVSTPGVLHGVFSDENDTQAKASIRFLVLDEADVLLDPLFREQTLEIWNSLSSPRLRVSMWSATMGSNIEELAISAISARRLRLCKEQDETIPQAPLLRLIVGLKDSAVPNVQHKLTYAASEQGKLMGLRQLLHPTTSSIESGPSLRPPFLVFTQTIERAIALHGELLYDIPPEAGGIDRIAVLHSDLSDTARENAMTRFRKGEIWVLITTDLLSRGVDFLGVNGVVNYDIPTSSAAYVHRIGRTGRAGRTGGVAVTLYSKEDIPYLKHVANVVALAQQHDGNSKGMDQWLLDALPKLSKNEKQALRKRGVESRTTRGKQNDPKAARKTQISSRSGYDRRMDNKRQGVLKGSGTEMKVDVELDTDDDDDDDGTSDFDGFD